MNSEKVKEIKKALEDNANDSEHTHLAYIEDYRVKLIAYRDILTLINELESENKELKKYRIDWLNGEKMHLQADLEETEFELASSNRLFEIVSKENKQLKDRIAELEFELSKKRLEINALKCGKEIAEGVIEVVEKEETKLALKQFAERLKEVSNYTDEHGYFVVNFDDIDETLKEMIEDDK